jgi:hypothetical protein
MIIFINKVKRGQRHHLRVAGAVLQPVQPCFLAQPLQIKRPAQA